MDPGLTDGQVWSSAQARRVGNADRSRSEADIWWRRGSNVFKQYGASLPCHEKTSDHNSPGDRGSETDEQDASSNCPAGARRVANKAMQAAA